MTSNSEHAPNSASANPSYGGAAVGTTQRCMGGYYRIMDLRPLDPTVLHGQDTHWSSLAWTSVDSKEPYCQHCEGLKAQTYVGGVMAIGPLGYHDP